MSAALTQIRSAATPLRKDINELQGELDRFNKTKVSLQVDMERAKRELADAKKAFRELEDEANATRLEQAQEAYNSLADQLREVSTASKQTVRDMEEVTGAISRASNRASRESDGSGGLGALAKAGLTNQVGQALSGAGSALISSAFGSQIGSEISSVLSGAAAGAAMGSVLPGVGTVIGAGVGALAGTITAATQEFTARDDAFKGVVQERYNGVVNQQVSDIVSGSGIAAGREGDLRALTAILGGDGDAAALLQRRLIEVGRTPPFSYDTAMGFSRDMLGLGLSTEETMSRIGSLANAAAALDLSESNVSSIVSFLESSQLAGKLETRVVKSLSKMGINAYEALAEEFGMSTDQVSANLGKLDVERGINAIYAYMDKRFGGAAEGMTDTYTGASGILDSYQMDMQNAYGEGYNATRKTGMEEQIDFLSGKGGEAMKEANNFIGQWQASLENLQEELGRDALAAVMGEGVSDSFRDAEGYLTASGERLKELAGEYQKYIADAEAGNEEAGAKIGSIMAEAQVIAQNEYYATEGYQLQLETSRDLVDMIQADTVLHDKYYNTGMVMGRKFTEGMASAMYDGAHRNIDPTENPGAVSTYAASYGVRGYTPTTQTGAQSTYAANGSHATGLGRVPFDGYRAILHEGERVLTAQEARRADQGVGGLVVNVNMDNTVIREEADISKIGQAVGEAILNKLRAGLT